MLALSRHTESHREVQKLLEWQNSDGSWPAFVGDGEGSWTTALALSTINILGGDNDAAGDKAAQWLLGTRGREGHWLWRWKFKLVDRQVRFDPDKFGWPWMPGSASWVIPTGFALIALKQRRACSDTRAVRMNEGLVEPKLIAQPIERDGVMKGRRECQPFRATEVRRKFGDLTPNGAIQAVKEANAAAPDAGRSKSPKGFGKSDTRRFHMMLDPGCAR